MAEHDLLAADKDEQLIRDEGALIERIRKGEKELFHELIQSYERSVYLSAYSILRNQSDAEEVAQEALL
jgi:RNA polymerase sigma-70 factor, ECF subfamily